MIKTLLPRACKLHGQTMSSLVPSRKTPQEVCFATCNTNLQKSCQGWAGAHFPAQQPTNQAVAACPVTAKMDAVLRPLSLCLSLPPPCILLLWRA